MNALPRRMLTDEERVDWLRLSRTAQVGPVTFFALIARYGSAKAALEELPKLAARAGRAKAATIPQAGEVRREAERAERMGARYIAAHEPDYPEALAAIEDAPPVILAGRNLELLERPTVAIVGARNASMNGRKMAARLAAELGEAGFVVVSGLARGIDTEAHKAALGHGTIAVVAGGIDIVYPPENRDLQARIFDQHCIVTEAPLGTEPMARHFPRRNRIISGLTPGVVVVEAAKHSGSLITARMALEQGREVFAVPGSPLDPRAQGANGLIRDGATLTETADDVLRVLTSRPISRRQSPQEPQLFEPPPAEASGEPEVEEARKVILEALSTVPVAVDELVRDCQVSLPVVLTILLELELAGRLERQAGQRVSLVP
ncbi:MAG TPA: DNA-processing protein DprA [Alphaproteobacteria bacterium]|nr:DNA-processing protein DprA [Alphaproteobacteria bacterium]